MVDGATYRFVGFLRVTEELIREAGDPVTGTVECHRCKAGLCQNAVEVEVEGHRAFLGLDCAGTVRVTHLSAAQVRKLDRKVRGAYLEAKAVAARAKAREVLRTMSPEGFEDAYLGSLLGTNDIRRWVEGPPAKGRDFPDASRVQDALRWAKLQGFVTEEGKGGGAL